MRRLLAVLGVLILALIVVVLHDSIDLVWRGETSAGPSASRRDRLAIVADRPTLRLIHHGRRSGTPYEVTIWFVVDGDTLYLTTMDRGRAWVRNVGRTPRVELQIGPERFAGTVIPVMAEEEKRREWELLKRKYWTMRLMNGMLRLAGRDPDHDLELGRGGFFRVEAEG